MNVDVPGEVTSGVAPRDRVSPWYPFIDQMITILTGAASLGQKPLLPLSNAFHAIVPFGMLLIGAGLSSYCTLEGNYPVAFLVSTLLVTGGARWLQLDTLHVLAHDAKVFNDYTKFLKKDWAQWFEHRINLDLWVSRSISTLLVITTVESYQPEHEKHHKFNVTGTLLDPDTHQLNLMGFKPGLRIGKYWALFWETLTTPGLYVTFIGDRIKSVFTTGSPRRQKVVTLFWVMGLGLLWANGWMLAFLIAWVWPLTIPYTISQFIQFLTEHEHYYEGKAGETVFERATALTKNRRPVSEPPTSKKLMDWVVWTVELVTVGLLCRTLIMPGSLPSHAWHHRNPKFDMGNHAFKALAFEESHKQWPPYREVWGIVQALEEVFETMSKASK